VLDGTTGGGYYIVAGGSVSFLRSCRRGGKSIGYQPPARFGTAGGRADRRHLMLQALIKDQVDDSTNARRRLPPRFIWHAHAGPSALVLARVCLGAMWLSRFA
jgi:hypothetical protein